MVKTKDDYPIIESYIKEIIKRLGTATWGNDNLCEIRKNGKILGKIILNDNEMISSGKEVETIHKELIKRKEDAIKNKLTPDKVKDTPLRNLFERSEDYNGLKENPIIFWKLNKKLKKFGIDEMLLRKRLTGGTSINKKLVLAIDCPPHESNHESMEEGYHGRLRNILYDKCVTDTKRKDNLIINTSEGWLQTFEQEKIEELKLYEMTIGRYYKERNLIFLAFNPFSLKKILPLEVDLHPIFDELLKEFKRVGVKIVKTEDLQQKMFISAFLVKSREQLRKIKTDKKDAEHGITTNERTIRSYIEKISNLNMDESYIQTNINMGGKNMFVEIAKTEKLSFIKNVDLGGDSIKLSFIPATIKVHNFTRTDHGKDYGRRTLYLGNITITISPRDFKVENNIKMGSYPHPHVDSSNGTPCFGSGEGRNIIYNLLAVNKFSEVAKMLWFWLKTYRNDGAHLKHWNAYDNMLKQGYPVWDEKGERISLNDAGRIKTGEQVKLTKADEYNDNIKKYKSMKIF